MPSPEAVIACLKSIAVRDLGDEQAAAGLQSILAMVGKMNAGADWFGRPAGRRAAYLAAAKTTRRLTMQLSRLNVLVLVGAFGGHIPNVGQGARVDTVADDAGPPAPYFPSRTPQRIREMEEFRDRLIALTSALDHLAAAELPPSRGQPETPDALMYGIEALAWEWHRRRGVDPQPGKRAGFENFVSDVLTCVEPPIKSTEIRTGLRRFFEADGIASLRAKGSQET